MWSKRLHYAFPVVLLALSSAVHAEELVPEELMQIYSAVKAGEAGGAVLFEDGVLVCADEQAATQVVEGLLAGKQDEEIKTPCSVMSGLIVQPLHYTVLAQYHCMHVVKVDARTRVGEVIELYLTNTGEVIRTIDRPVLLFRIPIPSGCVST